MTLSSVHAELFEARPDAAAVGPLKSRESGEGLDHAPAESLLEAVIINAYVMGQFIDLHSAENDRTYRCRRRESATVIASRPNGRGGACICGNSRQEPDNVQALNVMALVALRSADSNTALAQIEKRAAAGPRRPADVAQPWPHSRGRAAIRRSRRRAASRLENYPEFSRRETLSGTGARICGPTASCHCRLRACAARRAERGPLAQPVHHAGCVPAPGRTCRFAG